MKEYAAFGLAALAVVLVVFFAATKLVAGEPARSSANRDAIEQLINQALGSDDLTAAFKASFPKEYGDLLSDYDRHELVRDASGDVVVHSLFIDNTVDFIQVLHPYIAKAPDRELAEFARARAGSFDTYKDAPELGSSFVTGEDKSGDPAYRQTASAATVHAYSLFFAAALRAARAGIDRPQKRDGSVDENTRNAFLVKLKRLSPRSYELELNPDLIAGATQTEQSDLAIFKAHAVANLPESSVSPTNSNRASAGGRPPSICKRPDRRARLRSARLRRRWEDHR